MSIKTQLRLGQMTGSFGDVPGGIHDGRGASSAVGLTAISIQSGSMVGILSEMASALKRINGGGTFAGQGTGDFNHANTLFKNASDADTKVTIGNNSNQRDAILAFDGNAQDFHVGLDDTDDKLKIGLGTTPGTTPNMELNSADRDVKFFGDVEVAGGKITLTNGSTIDSETNGELQLTEDLVIVTGDLKVEGNDIKASDGTTAITMNGADVTIAGDLTVSGDTVTVNTAQLAVEDPLIQLASGQNNTTDAVDIGFYGRYGDGGTFKFAGLFRDQNDSGNFHLFKDTEENLSSVSVVNRGASGYTKGDLIVNSLDADGGITVDNITIDGTQIDLSSGDLTLDVAGDIILDADGSEVFFADGGSNIGKISNFTAAGANDFRVESLVDDLHLIPAADKSVLVGFKGGQEGFGFIDPNDGSTFGFITGSAAGLILSGGAANDILFKTNRGGSSEEVARFDASAGSFHLADNRPLEFGDAGENIKGDGTRLLIASSEDIRFDAAEDILVDSDTFTLKFNDGGTERLSLLKDGSDHVVLQGEVNDKDVIIKVNDGNAAGSTVATFTGATRHLVLNQSNAGGTNPGLIAFATDLQEAVYGDGGNLYLRSGNTAFKVPSSDGGNGDVLQTDGAGNLTFVPAGGATAATKVTGTAAADIAAGSALSGDGGFSAFDARAVTGELAPNAVDVFVNGQLLLSCSSGDFGDNAATIAANTSGDYYLSENFDDNNGGDVKFTFALEKDDVVVVSIRG